MESVRKVQTQPRNRKHSNFLKTDEWLRRDINFEGKRQSGRDFGLIYPYQSPQFENLFRQKKESEKHQPQYQNSISVQKQIFNQNIIKQYSYQHFIFFILLIIILATSCWWYFWNLSCMEQYQQKGCLKDVYSETQQCKNLYLCIQNEENQNYIECVITLLAGLILIAKKYHRQAVNLFFKLSRQRIMNYR